MTKTIFGMAMPVVDFYVPDMTELARGLKIIEELKKGGYPEDLKDVAEHGIMRVQRAISAWTEMDRFWRSSGLHPRDKFTLSPEQLPKVRSWFAEMREGARAINGVAQYIGPRDAHVQIRYVGGTITNKFHAIKGALGDSVRVIVYGLTGPEDGQRNRIFLLNSLRESGIEFYEPQGVHLPYMMENYTVLPPEGRGERVNLKTPATGAGTLLELYGNDIKALIAESDYTFWEGSDIGEPKFGQSMGSLTPLTAMELGKEIVFGAPTDLSLVIRKKDNAEQVERHMEIYNKVIDYPGTVEMTMNEEEAVGLFLNEPYESEGSTPSQLREALEFIRQRLRARPDRPASGAKPVAFVSASLRGTYAVTADFIEPLPVRPVEKPVDYLGAGDNFSAGCFVEHESTLARQLLEREPISLDRDALKRCMAMGQKLASAVVQQKSAQLPHPLLQAIVHGNVSVRGTVSDTPILTEAQRDQPWRGM